MPQLDSSVAYQQQQQPQFGAAWWEAQYVRPAAGHLGAHDSKRADPAKTSSRRHHAQDDDTWIYADEWAQANSDSEDSCDLSSMHDDTSSMSDESSVDWSEQSGGSPADWFEHSTESSNLDTELREGQSNAEGPLYSRAGVCCTRNGRRSMEDRHAVVTNIVPDHNGNKSPLSFYAVFDGHGSGKAAEFCRAALSENIVQNERFAQSPKQAIINGYSNTERQLAEQFLPHEQLVGTTSVAALVQGNKVTIANVGDSRAIVVRKNYGLARPRSALTSRSDDSDMHNYSQPSSPAQPPPMPMVANHKTQSARQSARRPRTSRERDVITTVALSRDHKPSHEDERARIEAAGGCVIANRVGGLLAMTRALGDLALKKYISAEPEVTEHSVVPEDEFLLLASDGLWDVLSNDEAGQLTMQTAAWWMERENKRRRRPQQKTCTGAIADALVAEAKARGSSDNITVIVVPLKEGTYASSSFRGARN